MKKFTLLTLILSLLIFAFIGCGNTGDGNSTTATISTTTTAITTYSVATTIDYGYDKPSMLINTIQGIKIYEREWCYVKWDEIYLPASESFKGRIQECVTPIETNQEAVDLALKIRDNCYSEKQISAITHSTRDNIWTFHYWMGSYSYLGGTSTVAIDANTWTIIEAWSEE